MTDVSTDGLLRPTHKPSTSSSSYQLITRKPSSASLQASRARPTRKLRRPYPLVGLSVFDLVVTCCFATGSQLAVGVIRNLVVAGLVGCTRTWRAKHGAVLAVCLGSLVSVLWETCQAVMDGNEGWRSPALAVTTLFAVAEYLTYILALRLSPISSHCIRYETDTVSTPSTPTSRPLSLQHDGSDVAGDDDASSISSSEIVDLPPPRSPARLHIDIDPARLVRRRSARFFGTGVSDEEAASSGDDEGLEEDRLGRSLSRSWRSRIAGQPEGYGTFR